MTTRIEAIGNFLRTHTHADLAKLYNPGMEVQVNVGQDGGVRVSKEFKGRSWHEWANPNDALDTWKSFRIPYNARTKPEYRDTPMKFDLKLHAEGVGMTGWNWQTLRSIFVAYDFDSIANHAQGLTAVELEAVLKTAMSIPWVTVRKSTSGSGYHFYVMIADSPEVANHNEHAALARAILGMLSAKTGFDFEAKVDICGGNMWCWHRKMVGTDGLTLIKQGGMLHDLPTNWRDHETVVSGNRRKNLPRYVEDSVIDEFDELCGTQPRQKLDEDHRRLLDFLEDRRAQWWWDQDRWMLVAHTADLKIAHTELNLKGIFDTIATGKMRGADHNCFCYPLKQGSWTVRRYTPGITEHDSWTQDGKGYTTCYLNRDPDLITAARTYDGVEMEKGGFEFNEAEVMITASRSLGANVELPPWAANRKAILKQHKKDGRLVVNVKAEPSDDGGAMRGWRHESGWWKRIYDTRVVSSKSEPDSLSYDTAVRHLITTEGEDAGWVIRTGDKWQAEPIQHVRLALKTVDELTDSEVSAVLGNAVMNSWKIVSRPFEDEFPGDRQWNRQAAQLRYIPKQEAPFHYPTWAQVFNHCGACLDDAVRENGWCNTNGILTGGEYLKTWVASMFQRPTMHLPYLFFFSQEENTGKSTFHQALSLLMTRGYVEASSALRTEFNGQLEGAVLCYIEETDLSQQKQVRERIKNYVTARQLAIRALYKNAYQVVNTTHWVHCANDVGFCPVFPGDSRITVVQVRPLDQMALIPEHELYLRLEKEAADFLGAVMSLDLPTPDSRVGVPVLETSYKKRAQDSNMSALQAFIQENVTFCDGHLIKFSDFYDRFISSIEDVNEIDRWTKIRVGKELPQNVLKGRYSKDGSKHYVANVSFDPNAVPCDFRWKVTGDKLERE